MRRVVCLAIALVLLAQVVVACASSAAGSGAAPTSPGQQTSAASRQISAEDLAKSLGQRDFMLVNVHIPYAGEIDGTDLVIPYDQIGSNLAQLPQDKGAKIVLYCRSGAMSAIAAKTLVSVGYTNVLDLKGGMEAWKDAGYRIAERPR